MSIERIIVLFLNLTFSCVAALAAGAKPPKYGKIVIIYVRKCGD